MSSLICEELDKPLAAEEEEEMKDKENETEHGERRKIRGRHNHAVLMWNTKIDCIY